MGRQKVKIKKYIYIVFAEDDIPENMFDVLKLENKGKRKQKINIFISKIIVWMTLHFAVR